MTALSPTDLPARKASSSEVAVLEFAVPVGALPIQLQRVIHAVDDTEFRLLLRALPMAAAAAYGKVPLIRGTAPLTR